MSSEWNHFHVMNEKSEDRKKKRNSHEMKEQSEKWKESNKSEIKTEWNFQTVEHINLFTSKCLLINNENNPIQNKWWSQKQWENNDEIKWKGNRQISWNQNNKRNRSITNIHKERRVCEYQQQQHGMEIEYQLHQSKMKLMTEWLVSQTFIISRNDIVIIWNRMTTFNLRTRDWWLFLTTDVFPDSFHDDREDRNWRCSKHTHNTHNWNKIENNHTRTNWKWWTHTTITYPETRTSGKETSQTEWCQHKPYWLCVKVDDEKYQNNRQRCYSSSDWVNFLNWNIVNSFSWIKRNFNYIIWMTMILFGVNLSGCIFPVNAFRSPW